MKKSMTFRILSTCLAVASCLGVANAAPYGPTGLKTKWKQPNGTTLELRVFGNENYGRTETLAGYTVVFKASDKTYYYATLNSDGSDFAPSATPANLPAPAGLLKHLELPKASIRKISDSNRAAHSDDGSSARRWEQRVATRRALREADTPDLVPQAKSLAAPLNGTKVGLTILVQFPNDTSTAANDPVNFPTTQAKIVRFCNGVGYNEDGNTGSVRDYYYDQSNGALTYTQDVTQVITMPRARNYYNYANYPTNTVLRADSSRVLITDAIQVLQASGFDFTTLSLEAGTNRVLATNVFFAGDNSGVFAQGLWPQQWNLANDVNVGTGGNPINIYKFQITDCPDSSPVIGTFCHENGHLICDFPDLYDYGYESEGVGNHCLMGAANYNNGGKTPGPIDIYLKDQVGWATITNFTKTNFIATTLPTTGNVAYRMLKPGTATEYFLIENRGSGDKWAAYAPDKGIAIWHIDETVDGNDNEQMTAAAHYEVSLEQADGRFDLEKGNNRGDALDLFDFNGSFTNATTPNARWWDNTVSGLIVGVTSAIGANTNVRFGALPANTIIVKSPNGGEVLYPLSTYPIYWDENITGNVKITLLKGGAPYLVIAANVGNNSTYNWKVPALPAGTDYAIRIQSLTNTTAVSDSSDFTFSVTNSTFPANNQFPFGWYRPADAKTGWKVSTSQVYEGSTSLQTINPGDGYSSAVAYRTNFKAGAVSFYIKVSSEAAYDYATFEIDGVKQPIGVNGLGLTLSGNVNWKFVSFPVAAGVHTFRWTYKKDDSFGDLLDTVWLDGLSMPDTNAEIAVDSPTATDITSGANTTDFGDVTQTYSSAPLTFTIYNNGTGDLTGIALTKTGTGANDFIVTGPGVNGITAGGSATFTVTFKPKARGLRTATLSIANNDSDENPFLIGLQGMGIGLPNIQVFEPESTQLTDGGSRNYGSVSVGSSSTKTYTIKNSGTGPLTDLVVSISTGSVTSFSVQQPAVTTLAAGEYTTFTATFSPLTSGSLTTALKITSNDLVAGPFDIKLTGSGVAAPAPPAPAAPASALAAALNASSSSASAPVTGLEVVDGQKYLSLTVTKPAGVIEVSPNLVDWYSGSKYTTVVLDNATTLTVRDNTPQTQGVKRYIRVRP